MGGRAKRVTGCLVAARWLVAGVLVALAIWLRENASLERLRADFIPWMHRLERYRDALQATRASLRYRGTGPLDAWPLHAWAWRGLEHVDDVSFDVEGKPEIRREGRRFPLEGRALVTVYGTRVDGARVERTARVVIRMPDSEGASFEPRLEDSLSEREEARPRFFDASERVGLGAPRIDPPMKLTNRLIEGIWPGSGVAVLDFDRDGAEDLFVGDGVRSILYRNVPVGWGRSVFHRDVEVPRFMDVTAAARLEGVAATGVAAADFDGDGFPDLAVTNAFGPTRLFRNRGDGTFEEITASSGVATPVPTRSLAFADVDADGDLDLFVCGTGDYYGPMPDPPFDANDGRRNFLFINDGRGRFHDATAEWGLAKATRWSLSCLFADYDDDGRPDLLVTNDFGLKNLYRNVEGKRFEDVTAKAGVEDRGYGMSAAWGDFDGDGRLDLYTTGTYTQWGFLHRYPGVPMPLPGRVFLPIAVSWMEKMCRGNSLFLQRDGGRFEDVRDASGARKAGWCWSAVPGDLDLDGRLDLYATNGMWGDGREDDRELEFWWETLAYWDDYIAEKRTFDRKGAGVQGIERDAFFRNRGGGTFEERGFLDGLDLATNGRSVVLFDANGDGALDVYVRSVQAPEALFLGTRKEGEHFLRLRLRGRGANTAGIGARVTATLADGRVLVRENGNASGFLATGSPVVHLGLGGATSLKALRVRWPSGRVQELGPVPVVDRTLEMVEP